MAKQAQVICPECNKKFYREDEEYEKVGNRYYHKECYLNSDKAIIANIHSFCRNKMGELYNRAKIDKQIKSYRSDGKTLTGILSTLKYWYDIKGNSAEKSAGGIGIVPYIYGEAFEYFYEQAQNKTRNANVDIEDYIGETEHYVINPTPIEKPKRLKLFDIQ